MVWQRRKLKVAVKKNLRQKLIILNIKILY
jgi:hypothetical protein